jgi:hypothetical protein
VSYSQGLAGITGQQKQKNKPTRADCMKNKLGPTVSAMLIAGTLMFTGCGKKLSGTYTGNGIPFTKITFTSGSKAELSMGTGQTMEATYAMEDDKVKFTMAGQTLVYTIDKNGCLNGGMTAAGSEPLCKK